VWALVVANIATWFLHTVALLVLVPGLPKPRFHARVFWPLLRFGLSVQGLGLLAFFKDNVSNTLLGVLAGTTSVGLFNFGLPYIQIPVLAVNVMARIQLPAYARLQTDPDGLFRALQGVLRISFVLGVPFLLVLVTGASWLVPVIYSAKWAPSIPVAWAFASNVMGGLAASPLFSLLQARGEAGLALWVFLG
jgi:O-antigen/teichoic acid export membrane protein